MPFLASTVYFLIEVNFRSLKAATGDDIASSSCMSGREMRMGDEIRPTMYGYVAAYLARFCYCSFLRLWNTNHELT